LRQCGAFFIRRQFAGDRVYSAIVEEYMCVMLSRAYNIEFFIEGGRSRTGKLLMPKLGMLKMVLNAYLDAHIKDAVLVPGISPFTPFPLRSLSQTSRSHYHHSCNNI
jgi:glycerol-3-phosphate O-acyltransferase